ncbi:MAG: hypothetical protein V4619_05505 [Bacteroidota bacterium]
MDNVKFQREILITYDSVFDSKFEIGQAFKTIPKTPAVEFIAYLLHLFNLRKRNDLRFQSGKLYEWMMRLESTDQRDLLAFIQNNNAVVNSAAFKLLERRSCLNLIQYLLVNADAASDRTLDRKDYSLLFKALLHFNSEEVEFQSKVFAWDDNGSFDDFVDWILQVQIRNVENERFKEYDIQFLKIYYFFKYCEGNQGFTPLLQSYLADLGLSSYKSYLWRLIAPYLSVMTAEPPSPKMFFDTTPNGLHFLNRMIINGHATLDSDFKQLRSYPLLKADDKTYVFLDFRFFIDKLYNGFLFDFAEVTGLKFPKLKQQMGDDFSEHVLFYSVMKQCFADYGNVTYTGAEMKAKLLSGESDYYIRKDDIILLFEFKDILIPASIKYESSIEKIKSGILEKLEKDSKGKKKGITQLLNSIEQIESGLYEQKGLDGKHHHSIIYPIIVHTDVSLESCGVNYFLNEKMKRYVSDSSLKYGRVGNLILINIETLIKLQDNFSDSEIDLIQAIESYIKYINTGDPINDTFPFDQFIKYHLEQTLGRRVSQPKMFIEVIEQYEREAGN